MSDSYYHQFLDYVHYVNCDINKVLNIAKNYSLNPREKAELQTIKEEWEKQKGA